MMTAPKFDYEIIVLKIGFGSGEVSSLTRCALCSNDDSNPASYAIIRVNFAVENQVK